MSYHDRRLAKRLEEDPEFRAAYEKAVREMTSAAAKAGRHAVEKHGEALRRLAENDAEDGTI
jgi:hypothetical protein